MTIVTVVETPEFQRRARSLMSEAERLALIDFVARNPATGVSIGGGVRKFRFAREGAGKSGGYRVIHIASHFALDIPNLAELDMGARA